MTLYVCITNSISTRLSTHWKNENCDVGRYSQNTCYIYVAYDIICIYRLIHVVVASATNRRAWFGIHVNVSVLFVFRLYN